METFVRPQRKSRANRHSAHVVKRTVKRAIKYRRVSVIRDNMTTMETQDEMIEAYCQMNKWEVVADLGDPGISAYSGKHRPDFEKAIQMIESGAADAIVVFRLDRFSRSIGEFWEAWERIKAAGGTFVSITERFDTSNEYGEMMLVLIAAFAQMESRMKADRAIPAHAYQKENGYVPGGPRPYGYDRIKSKGKNAPKDENGKSIGAILTINEKEADVIRAATTFLLNPDNGGNLRAFVQMHSPKSTQGTKEMTTAGLKYILTNPTTAGKRALNDGKFADGKWPAIIDEFSWYQLRAILLDPSRQPIAKRSASNQLLSGILICDKCGGTCYSRNWTCRTTRKQTIRYSCRHCYMSSEQVTCDRDIIVRLFEEVPQSKWESWQTSGMGWNPAVITELENKQMAIDRAFDSGTMNEARWLASSARIQEQINAATNNDPILNLPAIDNLERDFNGLDLKGQQQILKQAFRSIRLGKFKGAQNKESRIIVVSND